MNDVGGCYICELNMIASLSTRATNDGRKRAEGDTFAAGSSNRPSSFASHSVCPHNSIVAQMQLSGSHNLLGSALSGGRFAATNARLLISGQQVSRVGCRSQVRGCD